MVELPDVPRERMNVWGPIYFFNKEEFDRIVEVEGKVEDVKEKIRKQ
jgi:hypothetical protein